MKVPETRFGYRHTIAALCLAVMVWFTSACAPAATPMPTVTPVPPTASFYNTSAAPDVRPTLPPVWTATWTPSPTLTFTPSITPLPTATYSLADLCATLQADLGVEEGHVFAANDSILLLFGTTERVWTSQIQAATPTPDPANTSISTQANVRPAILTEPIAVRFTAVHRETGEVLGVDAPGGETIALQLPMSQLPLPGLYDWTISLSIGTLGEPCSRTGTFVVEAAPESTDEA